MPALTRRRFLQASLAAGAGAAATAPRASHADAAPAQPLHPALQRPNIVLLFTDQERFPQHWPAGWAERNLPSQRRLRQHGLTFRRAYTAASECTPSRATLVTGTYPTVSGVANTFSPEKGVVVWGTLLQTFQQNLGKLLAGADYEVVYKGKWHLSLPVAEAWSEHDLAYMAERYGMPGWNPPDAGTSLTDVTTAGGGTANNDGRYVGGMTSAATGQLPGYGESVLDFLARYDGQRPFCLFVALANPHDVGFFPVGSQQAGYRLADFQDLDVDLPVNFRDPLDTKPAVQAAWRARYDQFAPFPDPGAQREYVKFYAYLHTVVDRDIVRILDALDARGLTEQTLILRFADHGEMGLSHGLREKMYAAYEELIHVPLIASNPLLYPTPVETDAFASLVDLMPTVCSLAGLPPDAWRQHGCRGADLGPVLRDPTAAVQDAVLFTYDDGAGLELLLGAYPASMPTHIRALREGDWLYAVYFTPTGTTLQYELYDLARDPGQLANLAAEPAPAGSALDSERQRLHRTLAERLVAFNALPPGFRWPRRSGPTAATA